MGTRNLSLCKKDGEIVIAQYGQWDGYPKGQGKTILEFCQNKENITRLKAELLNIRDINTLPESAFISSWWNGEELIRKGIAKAVKVTEIIKEAQNDRD